MLINPERRHPSRENSQIYMTSNPYCPRIFRVNAAENTFFHIFFPVKSSERHITLKISPRVHNNLGKSFSKYKSHSGTFTSAKQDSVETGC